MWNKIIIGTVGSIIATVAVLLTRLVFYRIRDLFPMRALFKGIAGSSSPCIVFILRMTDLEQQGKFLAPLPRYAVASGQPQFEHRQLTPWVTSASETQSVAHVLNVLGRAGRTENIQISYIDQDYDKWDSPMFILGGSWKTTRSFETCDPYFSFRDNKFILEPTQEVFRPNAMDQDLGLLQKMINPATGFPVWIAMGWRGNGTNAATCALSRWWKEIGILYGSSRFGMLLEMNDRDGWQQCHILCIYPKVRWFMKLLHPIAWKRISRAMLNNSIEFNSAGNPKESV